MPTYEFRCPKGHEFEKLYRTISGAEAQAACPVCGEVAERILSPTGFSFKGSGFYLTDYGKNAHREKGSSANPAADASAGDATPSKPEAKAEGAKSDAGSASSSTATPAPAAETKPTAPKKSTGE